MDENPPTPRRGSSLISYFDVSSTGFAWREPRREQINDRRAAMDDKLIFDILLISGGIRDPDFLYPPRDSAGLQHLLDRIESSTYDTLKKHSLIYFLLKWHQDGREERFKAQFCIPPQFAALADAYFHLDTGINVAKAVSILSDARLNRDYASKIIRAISLAPDSASLIRKYVRTAKPPLVEPPDLLKYTLALAESSLLEAWQFQRTFPETDDMRPRLFNEILEWTVYPHPRPVALTQLVSLPLSQYEHGLLKEYALNPPHEFSSSAVALLQDLVCVRLVGTGKYTEAIKMDRQFSAAGYNSKEFHDRRTMIQELYESLPSFEKTLIDAELNPISKSRPKPNAASSAAPVSTPSRDVTMSQPWEDVRVPDALNKSTNTPLRNLQIPPISSADRIGTPRFTVPSANSLAPAASAAPLIPITANGFASGSASTPRKSLPLSNFSLGASLLGSGKGRPSLSGVGNRIAMGASPGVSSPASGLRFPLHTKSTPISHAIATPPITTQFTSAARQSNAFYQPKPTGHKRPLEDADPSPDRTKAFVEKDDDDEEEVMQIDREARPRQEEVPGWKGLDEGPELNRSIFTNRDERQNASGSQARTVSAQQPSAKKVPPGAFVDDDDQDGMHEDHEAPVEPQPAPTRKRSTQPRSKPRAAAAAPTSGKQTRRTRQLKEQELGRSLPGSLMDDDDDADAEEEEDQVAPLREPSPPPATRRPVRKSRSVASSDFGDDGEGVQTRRRSSRLTTTSSLRNISPEPSKAGSVVASKPKKSTRTGGTKKKK